MKRLIIDSKKMTPDIMALVKEKYPEGYYEDDIIVFKNHKNETVEAIQVETPDTVYLIKIGQYLSIGLENFEMDVEVDPQVKPGDIEEDSSDDDDDDIAYRDDLPDEDDDEDPDEEEDKEPAAATGKKTKSGTSGRNKK